MQTSHILTILDLAAEQENPCSYSVADYLGFNSKAEESLQLLCSSLSWI